jgi:hypothetical protein
MWLGSYEWPAASSVSERAFQIVLTNVYEGGPDIDCPKYRQSIAQSEAEAIGRWAYGP